MKVTPTSTAPVGGGPAPPQKTAAHGRGPAPAIAAVPGLPAARTPLPPPPARSLSYPPQVTPYPRQPSGELVRGITMAKSTFAGFCLIAFAFGIVTTVMIDRIWPRVEEEPATRLEPIAAEPPARPIAPEIQPIDSTRPAPPPAAPSP
jgi:hypothetical protein